MKQFSVAATLVAAALASTAVLADPPSRAQGHHPGGPAAQAQACDHGAGHGMRGHGHHERMAQHGNHRGHGNAGGPGHRHGGHGAQQGNAGTGCPMHEQPKNT